MNFKSKAISKTTGNRDSYPDLTGRTQLKVLYIDRTKLWVRQLNGDRAVVSMYKVGPVTGAVNVKDLIKL